MPIKVEETFETAEDKIDDLVHFKTALAAPEKKTGEEDVFYIFYESEGITILSRFINSLVIGS